MTAQTNSTTGFPPGTRVRISRQPALTDGSTPWGLHGVAGEDATVEGPGADGNVLIETRLGGLQIAPEHLVAITEDRATEGEQPMSTPHDARDLIAEKISEHQGDPLAPSEYRQASDMLDALTAAGYEVVKLPEPGDSMGSAWAEWMTGASDDLTVTSCRDEGITLSDTPRGFTGAQARALAAVLIAADNHQERNDD